MVNIVAAQKIQWVEVPIASILNQTNYLLNRLWKNSKLQKYSQLSYTESVNAFCMLSRYQYLKRIQTQFSFFRHSILQYEPGLNSNNLKRFKENNVVHILLRPFFPVGHLYGGKVKTKKFL